MKKIIYIYKGGRKSKIEQNNIESEEFFYGSIFLKERGYDVEIIEFDSDVNKKNVFLKLLDKLFNKFFSIPMYSSKLFTFNNLKKLYNSTDIFLINEGVGFSALFMLLIIKNLKNRTINLFVMGLFSKELRFKYLKFVHLFFISLLIRVVDNVLFLGKPEMEEAARLFPRLSNKFSYLPWCIDVEYWKNKSKVELEKKETILFVGNDGNRNQELLLDIVNSLPQYNFIFITKLHKLLEFSSENLKVYKGMWGNKYLTDENLKEIYSTARISIIPLKDSFQPSGQSVALQSISMGVPVLISDTKGFWDRELLKNNEDLILVKNDLNTWLDKLESNFNNVEMLELLSENSRRTIIKNFSIERFNNMILKLIDE